MINFPGAEKKLRQAVFFVGHLEYASKKVVGYPRDDHERLEFYFSACLTSAKSVYYVLQETGGATFREVQKRWRAALPESERSRFGRMMGLRDDDVHLASTDAEPLPKYVKEDSSRYTVVHPLMLGSPVVVEMENPDGSTVSGPVLRGTVGLYMQQQGRRIEATDACRWFIDQLRSLLDAMKAATQQKEAAR